MFNTVSGLYTLWKLREREQIIDKSDAEGVVEGKKIVRYVFPQASGDGLLGVGEVRADRLIGNVMRQTYS